ncbi:hypothetical protein [Flammeovirga sp. SJP92]|uniref:hypothetical protein n=1 Tax=Flammeovirga sp. SJP92 TaxID=1775430 RepID=UPI0007972F2F|nr:hypothetical protein [Flammeovirga sp. SJP92]KXX69549.1 hypothetical protein AVL50_15880 [Flammeovirga sp. SJP92]
MNLIFKLNIFYTIVLLFPLCTVGKQRNEVVHPSSFADQYKVADQEIALFTSSTSSTLKEVIGEYSKNFQTYSKEKSLRNNEEYWAKISLKTSFLNKRHWLFELKNNHSDLEVYGKTQSDSTFFITYLTKADAFYSSPFTKPTVFSLEKLNDVEDHTIVDLYLHFMNAHNNELSFELQRDNIFFQENNEHHFLIGVKYGILGILFLVALAWVLFLDRKKTSFILFLMGILILFLSSNIYLFQFWFDADFKYILLIRNLFVILHIALILTIIPHLYQCNYKKVKTQHIILLWCVIALGYQGVENNFLENIWRQYFIVLPIVVIVLLLSFYNYFQKILNKSDMVSCLLLFITLIYEIMRENVTSIGDFFSQNSYHLLVLVITILIGCYQFKIENSNVITEKNKKVEKLVF